jgi:hypothetical protein
MNNTKLKQEWKNFTTDHFDLHFTLDLSVNPYETKRLTKVFLNHLARKYPDQILKSLIFIIDHGNSRIYNSHAHCLIKCNPNYPKLYEAIQLFDAKENIFKELFYVFRSWKFHHNIPRASIKISCNKTVLKNLGIDMYYDFCSDCLTKSRNLDDIENAKVELERKTSKNLNIVNDPCKDCDRKNFGTGWSSEKIIKYIFEKHNFNVYDHHFNHEHAIDFYKWHLKF